MQVVSRKLKVNISLIIRYRVRLVIAMNGILFSRHMKYETQSIRKQSLIIFMIFISLFVASHFMTHHHCRIMPWKQMLSIHLTHIFTYIRAKWLERKSSPLHNDSNNDKNEILISLLVPWVGTIKSAALFNRFDFRVREMCLFFLSLNVFWFAVGQ